MAKKKGNNYIIDEEKGIAEIELQRRGKESLWTIIDLEDLEKVLNYPYTWSADYRKRNKCYYAATTEYIKLENGGHTNRRVLLHQFVTGSKHSVIDHINHDTLDNRKSNLRDITYGNNSLNRKSKNSNNKSGYRNVCWSSSDDKWVVQIQINGKNTVVGRFSKDKLEEAGKFAEEMRQKYYKEYKGVS